MDEDEFDSDSVEEYDEYETGSFYQKEQERKLWIAIQSNKCTASLCELPVKQYLFKCVNCGDKSICLTCAFTCHAEHVCVPISHDDEGMCCCSHCQNNEKEKNQNKRPVSMIHGRSSSHQLMLKIINSYRDNKCTLVESQGTPMIQYFFRCMSCQKLSNEKGNNLICLYCAFKCHKNCKIMSNRKGRGICNCCLSPGMCSCHQLDLEEQPKIFGTRLIETLDHFSGKITKNFVRIMKQNKKLMNNTKKANPELLNVRILSNFITDQMKTKQKQLEEADYEMLQKCLIVRSIRYFESKKYTKSLCDLNMAEKIIKSKKNKKRVFLNSKIAVISNNRGCIYFKFDQIDRALKSFSKAIKINRKDYKLDPRKLSLINYNRGYCHYLKKDYSNAIKDLIESRELYKNLDTKLLLCNCYIAKRDYVKSIERLQELLDQCKTPNPFYLYRKGKSLMKMCDFENAFKDLSNASKLDKEGLVYSSELFFKQSSCAERNRKEDLALELCTQALEINRAIMENTSKSPIYIQREAKYLITQMRLFEKNEKYNEALKVFEFMEREKYFDVWEKRCKAKAKKKRGLMETPYSISVKDELVLKARNKMIKEKRENEGKYLKPFSIDNDVNEIYKKLQEQNQKFMFREEMARKKEELSKIVLPKPDSDYNTPFTKDMSLDEIKRRMEKQNEKYTRLFVNKNASKIKGEKIKKTKKVKRKGKGPCFKALYKDKKKCLVYIEKEYLLIGGIEEIYYENIESFSKIECKTEKVGIEIIFNGEKILLKILTKDLDQFLEKVIKFLEKVKEKNGERITINKKTASLVAKKRGKKEAKRSKSLNIRKSLRSPHGKKTKKNVKKEEEKSSGSLIKTSESNDIIDESELLDDVINDEKIVTKNEKLKREELKKRREKRRKRKKRKKKREKKMMLWIEKEKKKLEEERIKLEQEKNKIKEQKENLKGNLIKFEKLKEKFLEASKRGEIGDEGFDSIVGEEFECFSKSFL